MRRVIRSMSRHGQGGLLQSCWIALRPGPERDQLEPEEYESCLLQATYSVVEISSRGIDRLRVRFRMIVESLESKIKDARRKGEDVPEGSDGAAYAWNLAREDRLRGVNLLSQIETLSMVVLAG